MENHRFPALTSKGCQSLHLQEEGVSFRLAPRSGYGSEREAGESGGDGEWRRGAVTGMFSKGATWMWDFVEVWLRLLPGNMEIMVHLNSAVISVTLMLNKPHSTRVYVLTLYTMSLDVYTIHIHTHMLITSSFANSMKGTNRDAF